MTPHWVLPCDAMGPLMFGLMLVTVVHLAVWPPGSVPKADINLVVGRLLVAFFLVNLAVCARGCHVDPAGGPCDRDTDAAGYPGGGGSP